MTHKLELPAGGVAEMKDSNEITRGEKKKVENSRTRAASDAVKNFGDTTPEALAAMKSLGDADLQPYEGYQNLMITTCLVAWPHGKLPVDDADFDAMADEDYEALVNDAFESIFRRPLEFGPDGAADPKAPIASSNGSAPTSPTTDASSETTTPTQP